MKRFVFYISVVLSLLVPSFGDLHAQNEPDKKSTSTPIATAPISPLAPPVSNSPQQISYGIIEVAGYSWRCNGGNLTYTGYFVFQGYVVNVPFTKIEVKTQTNSGQQQFTTNYYYNPPSSSGYSGRFAYAYQVPSQQFVVSVKLYDQNTGALLHSRDTTNFKPYIWGCVFLALLQRGDVIDPTDPPIGE